MRKLIVLFVFILIVFLSGCEALTMSPDAWLDPHRWEQQELADADSDTLR
ncbi:MAG: hypothetical protein ACYTBJ_13350 [Planctomycetota bacterium]